MAADIPERATMAAEVFDHLGRTARRIRQRSRTDLVPLGLTPAQVRALFTVDRLTRDDRCPAVRMGDLARSLEVVPRSATDVVDALVGLGLLWRGKAPDDGRAVVVALTDDSRALLDRLAAARRSASVEAFEALSDTDLRLLRDLLVRLDQPEQRRP